MSRFDGLRARVRDRPLLTAILVIIGAGAAAGLATGQLSWPSVSLSQRQKVLLLAAVVFAIPGRSAGKKIVAWLGSISWFYLIDIDAGYSRGGFAVWRLSEAAWRDVTVVEGELFSPGGTLFPAYFCEGFDEGELEARGTWRGSASDLELIRERERIREVRNDLEDRAKWAVTIRIRASSIVRQAVREITMAIVAQYEDLTMFRGDALENAIDEATEDLDLEKVEQEVDESRSGMPVAGAGDRAGDPAPEGPAQNGTRPEADAAVAPDGGSRQ